MAKVMCTHSLVVIRNNVQKYTICKKYVTNVKNIWHKCSHKEKKGTPWNFFFTDTRYQLIPVSENFIVLKVYLFTCDTNMSTLKVDLYTFLKYVIHLKVDIHKYDLQDMGYWICCYIMWTHWKIVFVALMDRPLLLLPWFGT